MSQHEKIVYHLKVALANHYVLAVKLQNYHWHVMGLNFKSLHEMFGAEYEAMAEAVDLLAERLRALGAKTPATLKEFLELATITEGDSSHSEEKMLCDLLVSFEQLNTALKVVHETADNEQDCATTKLLEDLLFDHEKFCWMLRSSLPTKN